MNKKNIAIGIGLYAAGLFTFYLLPAQEIEVEVEPCPECEECEVCHSTAQYFDEGYLQGLEVARAECEKKTVYKTETELVERECSLDDPLSGCVTFDVCEDLVTKAQLVELNKSKEAMKGFLGEIDRLEKAQCRLDPNASVKGIYRGSR